MRWWKSAYETKLEGQIALLADRAERAQTERDYWKRTAEKLLDAALFKRDEIRAPVFQDVPKPKESPMLRVLGAMQTHEIDTSKYNHVSTAAPVTPMT